MRKRNKVILGVIGTLVAIVIIGLLIFYFALDGIIKGRVETATTAATGQKATLDSANLGLFSGTLALNGLDVSNPPAFGQTPFMTVKQTNIGVQIGSLMSDTVQVPTITLDGLHVVITQQGLQNNLQQVLQSVQKTRDQASGGAAAPAPASASKQLNIGRITLTNTTITFHLQGVPGVSGGDFEVPIKQLVLDHPTNPDGRAMRIADVLAQVLVASSQAAMQDPRVPPQVRTVLGGLTDVEKNLPNLLQGLQNGKVNQQDVNNLVQGIGGLINQQKNKNKPATTAPAK